MVLKYHVIHRHFFSSFLHISVLKIHKNIFKFYQIFQKMQLWKNKHMQVCTEWTTDSQLF